MKDFSRNRIMNYTGISGLHNGNSDKLTDHYVLLESKLRSDLIQAESENYSEFSVDTSSDSSKFRIQANQNTYAPEIRETRFAYGSSDGGTSSPLELPEMSRSLLYSDDEMSEILSLDQTLKRAVMDEHEELRYLHELVQNADYYDESEYGAAEELFWNMDVTQESNADLFPSDSMMWNTLCEEDRLRWLILHESQTNLYRELEQAATYQPVATDNTQILENRRKPQKHGQWRPQRAKQKEQKQPPLPSIPTLKRENKAKSSQASNGEKRIFLGGLPIGMKERMLRQHLALLGYKVMKRPKILRGFAPEVWMRSVKEANELVERGTIMINGYEVEVRPFNHLMKQSESRKIPNSNRRSIFLGGLPRGTTAKDIQNALAEMGIKILNYPLIKFGCSRRVILENTHQAKTLIEKKKVLILGTLVDVRPFVRQQRRQKRF